MSWGRLRLQARKGSRPARCSRTCGDCDGEHHFYIQCQPGCDDESPLRKLPEGVDPNLFFACKHCETVAEAVDDFGGEDGME